MPRTADAKLIAARIRRHICDGNFGAANANLEDYQVEFGPTRGYFNLMREIDHARHAEASYRDAYNLVRAR